MAFRLADVKKTVRSRSDGERYIHPKLLDGVTMAAQIGLVLSYFNARLGRTRRDLDAEAVVRFLGDPKVARGVVTCLGNVYRWRAQEFAEVLDPARVAALAAREIYTPIDLRLHLYDAVNAHGDGFLAAERESHLQPIAARLRLSAAKVDQLAALDAEENAILERIGPVPTPEAVTATYNVSVLDALLRNSVRVEVGAIIGEAQRPALEAACRRYDIPLIWHGAEACVEGTPDAFGSYARRGALLARALYSAGASIPHLLTHGTAYLSFGARVVRYPITKETRAGLTARTGALHCGEDWPEFRALWDRYRSARTPGGWRLVNLPEPQIGAAGLVVAPLALRGRDGSVALWPVRSRAALDDACLLWEAGERVLPVFLDSMAEIVPRSMPHAYGADGIAGIMEALTEHWGGSPVRAVSQALDALLDQVDTRGFVTDGELAEVLGCVSSDELAVKMRGVDAERGLWVPGVGLCSVSFAADMRKGLRRARRKAAAKVA